MVKKISLFFCACSLAVTLHGQDQYPTPLDSHDIMIDIGDNNTFNVVINTPIPESKNEGLNNAYNEDFFITRKPGRKHLILTGLAQACSDLGQIVGAANKQEKQQGYLNLLSTVLQVSAGLQNQAPQTAQAQQPAAQSPVPSVPTKSITALNDNEDVAQLLLNVTEKLTTCMATSPIETTRALTPLIGELMQLSSKQTKLLWLNKLLGDKQLSAQFLHEIFSTFYSVLCSYIPSLSTQTPSQETLQVPYIEPNSQTPITKENNDSTKQNTSAAQ